MTACAVAGVL